ncbi:DUF4194 domain-containing protein [Kocuria nitroreducens]|uniref:DUF4194 domain-containing protein n=1 Tax=Kocuria nitroreducens TaxID=3058914 RepID=UPI0036D911A9
MTADAAARPDGAPGGPEPARPSAPDQLWDGDTGTLSADARRTFVQLVKGPYLSRQRHGQLWSVLTEAPELFRSRLADLFLELVLDADHELAFVRTVRVEELDVPRLTRTKPMTFMDTAMLLHLRRLVTSAQGERVMVGEDDVLEHMEVYRDPTDTDRAGFTKRVSASWTKLTQHGVLQRAGEPGRREISPILRLIFGPEEVRAVQAEYDRIAAAHAQGLSAEALAVPEADGADALDEADETEEPA